MIAAVLGALALAAPAAARTPILDAAADSFRDRSVFFLYTTSTRLTPDEVRRLEGQIEQDARGPLYVAVLPSAARREADGTTTGVVLELSRRIVTTNPPAVHAAVIGDEFRAVNRDIPAGDLAAEALEAHRDERLADVLSDFIRRVGEAREETAAQAIEPEPASDGGGSDRWIIAALAAIAVAVAVAALAGRKRGEIGPGR